MKKSLVYIFAAFVLYSGIHPPISRSQDVWVKTEGPLGGLGYDVRIDPTDRNILFVTDNWSGVNKSTNAGETWFSCNTGIDVLGGPTGDAIVERTLQHGVLLR